MSHETANPTNIPSEADPSQASARKSLESSRQHMREASESLRSNLSTSKEHVKLAAEDLRTAAQSTAEDLRTKAETALDEVRQKAQTWQNEGEQYIRQNPTKSVLTALAAGFVLGLIIRR